MLILIPIPKKFNNQFVLLVFDSLHTHQTRSLRL
ncbi:Protein of unknown function [Pyronema omphalodes CBS 100304]|uniref:Uncharacterized protein n=1 Tax=Pyronema omphalodes (strain CBS 100304) TaxID=1076935 RepID=U4LQX7_PYROM|nr:Protein of unknown function [Pyronema omphalodes CBS 100304]